ncbi:glutamate carboxypeptidase [Sphingomonas sp.]|uniref:glutamate carboxypeptidase n=1 Tax=Sphingomonas sp. TaxID=28214 RepID=UPI001E053F3D|nr:glutamate carboxypeptidase [Sphingomonas sp.]MBX9797074.1 M20/M25/M40 family metallo-hydrolase [Sphingomonas sp.]
MRPSLIIATALALCLPGAALAAPRDAAKGKAGAVWQGAEGLRAEQLALLEKLVNIDSGTGNMDTGPKVQAMLGDILRGLGMEVRFVPAEAPGLPDNLVATLKGRGKGRLLLIGHSDTVFEPGTAAKRPFRMDETYAYGPGVGDEKGGVVQGIMAIKLLKQLKFDDFAQITFLIETSEERGSPGTRKLIAELVQQADVELNLEPGQPGDAVTVWRKGSSAFEISVKGRPAHAGVAPQEGRNAASELIHQLLLADGLPKSGDGLTSNLTLIQGGARYNIIPEDAHATLNVRLRTKQQGAEVEALLKRNAETTLVPDTRVSVKREDSFPPLPTNPGTEALADLAGRLYGEIGMTLGRGGNGGASESALAYEGGIPAIDGLGPINQGAHSERETITLASVTPRLYLLTRLMMELGKAPPPRLK